jgi:hypothetical protein
MRPANIIQCEQWYPTESHHQLICCSEIQRFHLNHCPSLRLFHLLALQFLFKMLVVENRGSIEIYTDKFLSG